MNVIRRLVVPTGEILILEGDKGKLEALGVGDYGKDINLKANFLGLTREPSLFSHTEMLPLEEKWVVTISTQYGCSMNCTFCDVPKVGRGRNATLDDLMGQVQAVMDEHPEVKRSDRLNVHFARMGEPSFNPAVIEAACQLELDKDKDFNVHPVVSTMMPRKNKHLRKFILDWMHVKNNVYSGNAGLQISINSTDEGERETMFGGNALTLAGIAEVMQGVIPAGRKITLNFAVADYIIDPGVILEYFNPKHYLIKLTPMHRTNEAVDAGITTVYGEDYTDITPYKHIEDQFLALGYDVIVFLASDCEDLSRITCGNAILSGTEPFA